MRWLIVGIVLMALTIVVFARGMRGLAVDVTVADDAVVRWLVGLQAPGLVGGWRAWRPSEVECGPGSGSGCGG